MAILPPFRICTRGRMRKKARPEIHQGTRSNAFPHFFRDRLSHYHKRARAWSHMYGRSSDPCGGGTPAACITFFIRYRNYLIPRASESVGGALLQPAVASVRARVRASASLSVPWFLPVCASLCVRVPPSVHAQCTRGGNTRDVDL